MLPLSDGRMVRACGIVTYMPPLSGFETSHRLMPMKRNAHVYAFMK